MPTKPTSYPEWASSGDIVEPTAAKKAAGNTPGEHIIHAFENWTKNLAYRWIQWFDEGAPGSWTTPATWAIGSLTSGTFLMIGNTAGPVPPSLSATGPAGAGAWEATISVPLSKGTIVNTVKVRISILTGGAGHASVFTLRKTTGFNQTAAFPTLSAALDTQTSGTAIGEYVLTLTPGSPITIDNDTMIVIDWTLGTGGDGVLWGYRVD
jgi:hypothetical protein